MLVDVTQHCFSPSNLHRTLARTLCLSGRNPNVRKSFGSSIKKLSQSNFFIVARYDHIRQLKRTERLLARFFHQTHMVCSFYQHQLVIIVSFWTIWELSPRQLNGSSLGPTQLRCSKTLNNTRGGTRTHNLLLRREAPYPLGHTSMGNGVRRTVNVSLERIYGKSSSQCHGNVKQGRARWRANWTKNQMGVIQAIWHRAMFPGPHQIKSNPGMWPTRNGHCCKNCGA